MKGGNVVQAEPRILVISHNVFSNSSAMGKTLVSMLSCVNKENLAQLYFHSERPTTNMCENYLRIRDQDILFSVITRNTRCRVFDSGDIKDTVKEIRTDTGLVSKIYQFSRKRTPPIYNARNLMWKLGKWDTTDFWKWINDFSPDLIFFASGDYAFSYEITYEISRRLEIPIVMWCCDDFYIGKRHTNTLGGRYCYKNLMKWVKKISERVESIVVISDKMKRDYGAIFTQPISVVRISAPKNSKMLSKEERSGIVYVGGLGVNRIEPLLELGRQLSRAKPGGYECIDVYSGDKNEHTLKLLVEENGIRFHGAADPEEVEKILGRAKFILHVEAFDSVSKARTAYSLSTKIGESLRSGACIFAYGPLDISSIEYLKENEAAVILKSAEEFGRKICQLSQNPDLYEKYVSKAQALADKNHSQKINNTVMAEILHCHNITVGEKLSV